MKPRQHQEEDSLSERDSQTAKPMEVTDHRKCGVLWQAGVRIDTEERAGIDSNTVKFQKNFSQMFSPKAKTTAAATKSKKTKNPLRNVNQSQRGKTDHNLALQASTQS